MLAKKSRTLFPLNPNILASIPNLFTKRSTDFFNILYKSPFFPKCDREKLNYPAWITELYSIYASLIICVVLCWRGEVLDVEIEFGPDT